jgi:hypothetical protein
MTQDGAVTTGEIYRRLCDMDERYEKKLNSIDLQVRMTNGRTTRLEEKVLGINRDIRGMKQAHPSGTSIPVATPDGESIQVRISSRMWVGICGAVAFASPLIFDWLKNWLQKP